MRKRFFGSLTDPHLTKVVSIWRRNGLKDSTIALYAMWVKRFFNYCDQRCVCRKASLTLEEIKSFATEHASKGGIDPKNAFAMSRSALFAWSAALSCLGCVVQEWDKQVAQQEVLSPMLEGFCKFRREHNGVSESRISKEIKHLGKFVGYLHQRKQRIKQIQLNHIDSYIIELGKQSYAQSTVADVCSSLRTFLRFLHVTGQVKHNFAQSVSAPVVRRGARPPRAMAWGDVQAILKAVDRATPIGKRDYALLLMMSVYGMGAGEVLHLQLDDINWSASKLQVTRPKTSVLIELPLLAPIARALVAYLRHGRPQNVDTRVVFLSSKVPYKMLSGSSAIRHLILKYVGLAGITPPYLGSHVFRHTHAGRQVDQGSPSKVVSDILGHRSPESMSAYLRIATEQLRSISIAVPR